MQHLQSALGVFALLAFAYLISENRRAVDWKSVGIAFAVTVATAVLLLEVPQVKSVFAVVGRAADAIGAATRAGTSLVFGYVGGGALPFDLKSPGADFVLAFQALPIVLVMSVLTTLLFHWRILPPIVRGFSWLLERTMGIGGAVGLSTAANIFLGMVESPLFIKPYLGRLTRGELFMVMTGGMAGIAGTVFVLYATILKAVIPDVAGHILVASIVSAPGALLVSMLMVPDKKGVRTDMGGVEVGTIADSTMDAIVRGTAAGLELLPYVVSKSATIARPAGDPFNTRGRPTMRAGLDLKDRLTSNLTLDATFNPDFGQVEVDPAVLNLSQFETWADTEIEYELLDAVSADRAEGTFGEVAS